MLKEIRLDDKQLNIAKSISTYFNISLLVAELMVKRGITTIEQAEKFLNPGKRNFIDPYKLTGMKDACEKILSYVKQNKKILIYGDYDADGICATSILYYAIKKLGVECDTYIPERDYGYGITEKSLQEILPKRADLIITVDCGISCKNEIATIKSSGTDVIVTDHHELPQELPDCINVNCKIKGEYPYSNLCGAGVAYKLAYALIGEEANELLDFVAVATIADNMTLTDENRDLVVEGLKLLETPRIQFKALFEASRIRGTSATSVAFTIAPRINAGGRMGDARSVLKLMLSQDEQEINSLAIKLNEFNAKRQTECDKMFRLAKDKIEKEGLSRGIIVLEDKEFLAGSMGIVASRIMEKYYRPVILFAHADGELKGSARSIEGINIFDVLTSCKDSLIRFGGHSQAAGLAIKKEDFAKFKQDINAHILENNLSSITKTCEVDKIIFDTPTLKDVQDLIKLEPCGVGNKKPLFAMSTNINSLRELTNSHLAIKTDRLDLIYFGGASYIDALSDSFDKYFIFELGISEYNFKKSVQGVVKGFEKCVDDQKAQLCLFSQYLKKVGKELACKKLSKHEIDQEVENALKVPYGTIFALSNLDNLKHYEKLNNLKVDLFTPSDTTYLNRVVLSLQDSKEYKNVIYLDNCEFENALVCKDIPPFNINFSIDRSIFVQIFKEFKLGVYKNSVDFALKNNFDKFQAVFVLEVFTELGLLKQNGLLRVDNNVKNDLSNSKILQKFTR